MLLFRSFLIRFLTALEKNLRGNCKLCSINWFPYTLFVDTRVQHLAFFAFKTNRSDLKKMLFIQLFLTKFLTALEKKLRGNCLLCNINLPTYTFFVDTPVQQMASFALKTNKIDLKKMILLWFKNKRLLQSFSWSTCMLFFHS